MKAVYLVTLGFLLAGSPAFGQQRLLTTAQGETLVRAVLRHEHFKVPSKSCGVELLRNKDGTPFMPDYYSYSADCDYAKAAATTPLGIFIVSPRTGQVWAFIGCTPFTFPELVKLRRSLLSQSDASEKTEEQYWSRLGCEPDPVAAKK
jgi:hypothetical protein